MIIVSQNKKTIVNFDSIFKVDAAPGTVMGKPRSKSSIMVSAAIIARLLHTVLKSRLRLSWKK